MWELFEVFLQETPKQGTGVEIMFDHVQKFSSCGCGGRYQKEALPVARSFQRPNSVEGFFHDSGTIVSNFAASFQVEVQLALGRSARPHASRVVGFIAGACFAFLNFRPDRSAPWDGIYNSDIMLRSRNFWAFDSTSKRLAQV